MTNRRQRARDTVFHIAELLADPERVTSVVEPKNQWIALETGSTVPIWSRASLASGYSGLALFFAELSELDPSYAKHAHDYLNRAMLNAHSLQGYGLHQGVTGLAFAAAACARGMGAFHLARSRLDSTIEHAVLGVTRRVLSGQVQLASIQSYDVYDPLKGITGVGEYLLTHGPKDSPLLPAILRSLVELGRPFQQEGMSMPGWWISASPASGIAPYREGHLNFGLAHGMAGPLALFARSWHRGVRVQGHEDGAATVAEALVRHAQEDEIGLHWPRYLEWEALGRGNGPRSAPTWCYGGVGIAHALQFAGVAFGQPAWKSLADEVMRVELIRLSRGESLTNSFVCHGWAGLLLILHRYRFDSPNVVSQDHLDTIADRILGQYRDDVPFGFRVGRMGDTRDVDIPGLLEGSAGVALALAAYLNGKPSTTGWSAIFSLS
ncbi:lanthionine synthetase C family protein [Nonomuraea sp. CA-143628]|uniref:lanthionine synthetase C family protein n=1 Tax=Nonomuraea sp. CA-143628 TaxID=3239997 RepID=UPI003D90E621